MLTKEIVRDKFVEFFALDKSIVERALSYYDGRDIEEEYHTIKHLYDMLLFIEKEDLIKGIPKVLLGYAILYHDAIYEIPSQPLLNEYNSANMAECDLTMYSNLVITQIEAISKAIVDTGNSLHERMYDKTSVTGVLNIADIHTFFTDNHDIWRDTQNKVEKEYSKAYSRQQLVKGRVKFFDGLINELLYEKIYNVCGSEALSNFATNILTEHRNLQYEEFSYGYKNTITF